MQSKKLLLFTSIFLTSCQNNSLDAGTRNKDVPDISVSDKRYNPYPVIDSIPMPQGFNRMQYDSRSFAAWLSKLNLKKDKTVFLYDGRIKTNQTAQFAVLNITVGNKDLQQCADAVMRLRAEYLFAGNRFNEIVFYDNDHQPYRFTAPYSTEHLHQYLLKVFGKCGTASLSKQLHKKDIKDIEPGDVFIRGGFPGHAVIVMDVVNDTSGNKQFMLAQSYMPAQDIHVLNNEPASNDPWFSVPKNNLLETPEYDFKVSELMGW